MIATVLMNISRYEGRMRVFAQHSHYGVVQVQAPTLLADGATLIQWIVERVVQCALWAAFVSKTVYGEDARAMSLRAWLVQRK
jgi:hypothetical protein